jgi:hypothetical protein
MHSIQEPFGIHVQYQRTPNVISKYSCLAAAQTSSLRNKILSVMRPERTPVFPTVASSRDQRTNRSPQYQAPLNALM